MDSTAHNRHSPDYCAADDPLLDYPDSLIINRPELKSRTLIFGEEIVTLIFWGFWIYLWLPIVSLIAWLLGFRLLYVHMVELGGFDGFLEQLDTFTLGIALVSGTLACWSFYNLKRYGKYKRRNNILATDLEKLAEEFSVTPQKFQQIQQAKRITFSFDEQHEISGAETSGSARDSASHIN
jgi:biofilm PGA synthesis protein PgaD